MKICSSNLQAVLVLCATLHISKLSSYTFDYFLHFCCLLKKMIILRGFIIKRKFDKKINKVELI